jgi:hypothetical protein
LDEARQERELVFGSSEASLLDSEAQNPEPLIRGIDDGDDLVGNRGLVESEGVKAIVSIASISKLSIKVELIFSLG